MGKESNRLEEVEAGLVHDRDDVETSYIELLEDRWARAVPILKQNFTQRELADFLGVSKDYVKKILAGKRRPAVHREALIRLVHRLTAPRLTSYNGIKVASPSLGLS